MTDAKQEALRQALHYHYSMQPSVAMKDYKRATAEQVIATAKKFEHFLDPQNKKR